MSEQPDSIVYLIDDDASVLRGMERLLRSTGLKVRVFTSPRVFIDEHDPSVPGCIVLDVAMPEIDGLALQNRLASDGKAAPVIFMSGSSDIPTSVRAMKAGAIDFLTKPVRADDLIAAVYQAFAKDRAARVARSSARSTELRVSTLTPREREVMAYVVAGKLNKQIAEALGTVEKTVKVHRGRMMHKMGVRSVADLVRLVGLPSPNNS